MGIIIRTTLRGTIQPQSEFEAPLGAGAANLAWLAYDPTRPAYPCKCSRKDCALLWGKDLAIRVGKSYWDISCAIRKGTTSRKEVSKAFEALCQQKGIVPATVIPRALCVKLSPFEIARDKYEEENTYTAALKRYEEDNPHA